MDMEEMMKAAQQAAENIQKQMNEAQVRLDSIEVEGSSGGGLVKVTADGQGRIRQVKIDPSVVDPEDVEMLEDLVQAAVSDVQARARELYEEEIGRMTGGLNLFNLGSLFGGS